jgi:hypothetical protein
MIRRFSTGTDDGFDGCSNIHTDVPHPAPSINAISMNSHLKYEVIDPGRGFLESHLSVS